MRYTNIVYIFLFPIVFIGCAFSGNRISLDNAKGFPRWVKDGKYASEQTSGITYIGKNNKGDRTFLIVDDIGAVHHLVINEDSKLSVKPVYYSPEVRALLKEFPKADLEEIAFDPYTKKVYISIEGNGKRYKEYTGIYEAVFENNDPYKGSIKKLVKLEIKPMERFLEKTGKNLGFEGMTVDRDHFYFGLEGNREDVFFSSGAYIYVVSKKTLEIEKIIETEKYDISTVCGLHMAGGRRLIGVDRNSREMFIISLDDSMEVSDVKKESIPTSIPGYEQYNYSAAIESITMDDQGNVYMVDDPWKSQYIPADFILSKLDASTQDNFRRYVPIIYKFKIKN